MKTTLLVMTLNEIDGMKAIMPLVKNEWVDQIIVVDGGSTDGTIEWAGEQGYEVYVQKQRGFRHAYTEVMPLVSGDVIITFSPDGNSIPELIPDLIAKMSKGYDMVIVSRYLGPAKSYDDDVVTGFGNWIFTKTVNVLHGGSYTDVMVIYRAYRKQIVYDLELVKEGGYALAEKLFHTKISWEPLLSVRAAKRKLKVTEIPGDEPPRIGGERKLQILKWGAAYYFQFIREVFLWK
jgi:glycosyltransferase involved in cell wall biosynthesis|tara:strand:+ start:3307 stop:4011 length:705 start_codon:yes stop_codon:yes gene_type:complete